MRKSLFLHIALVLGTMPMLAFADNSATTSTAAIGPMPLNQALEMFARQTGLQIVYRANISSA